MSTTPRGAKNGRIAASIAPSIAAPRGGRESGGRRMRGRASEDAAGDGALHGDLVGAVERGERLQRRVEGPAEGRRGPDRRLEVQVLHDEAFLRAVQPR